jgi:hypothetical protein
VDETDAVIVGWSAAGDPGAFVELVWRPTPPSTPTWLVALAGKSPMISSLRCGYTLSRRAGPMTEVAPARACRRSVIWHRTSRSTGD